MRTVLIVDDERPARELLKMTLDWEALGFLPPIEANNGKSALEQFNLHKPDYIITDIQMPVMDGLELIENIKVINPYQRIIVLSCHESFSYAKKALKLGVMDYLIKDALSPDALADILLSTSTEIEENTTTAKKFSSNIIKLVINETLSTDKISEILSPFIADKNQYFCCAVSTGRIAPAYTDISDLCEAIIKLLNINYGGDVFWVGENIFFILVIVPLGISSMQNLNIRSSLLHSIRDIFKNNAFEKITIGVSNFTTNSNLISEKLNESQTALKSMVFLGKGKTIYFDSTQICMTPSNIKILETRIGRIKDAVSERNNSIVQEEIKCLYGKDLHGIMQHNYLQHINTLLLTILTERCLSEDIPFVEVFDTEMLSELPTNGSCETVEEMQHWYLDRFNKYFEKKQLQSDYHKTPRVQKIKQYIEDSYDKDISLEAVADKFNLHKVYLAKIFKESENCSINEYIRKIKSEKAKKLLSQKNIRINSIVEMLGFNNAQSFYNMFKHSVGMSPKEYREQLKIDDD